MSYSRGYYPRTPEQRAADRKDADRAFFDFMLKALWTGISAGFGMAGLCLAVASLFAIWGLSFVATFFVTFGVLVIIALLLTRAFRKAVLR